MNKIKRLRMQNLMSQKALAEKMGVSQPTVWAWENNVAFPGHKRMKKLAALLHTTVDELLKDE